MTAAEWRACGDPAAMLEAIPAESSRARRLKLFAVGCCRRCPAITENPLNRKALNAVEEWADGRLSERKLRARRGRGRAGAQLATACQFDLPGDTFAQLVDHLRDGHSPDPAEQCRLVRCIFGDPFRPVVFDPVWRTPTAVAIARGMYEARDFGAMPILADALQDAGCDDAEVLRHCREPGVHVRGCWVADGVLEKG